MLHNLINKNKLIIKNTIYLSIIQVIRISIPFIALPYIISVIGEINYGRIIFSQSIAAFAVIVVTFGLDIYAVKLVSQSRDDKKELARIVSNVMGLKFLLFLFSATVYTIIVMSVPQFSEEYILFFIAFGVVIPELIYPTWFFQGVEKMGVLTLTNFFAIIFYVSLVFVFVIDEDDYLWVPILQIGGVVLSSFLGLYMLITTLKSPLVTPKKDDMVLLFKESLPFFFSRLSAVTNVNIAKVVAGTFLGMSEVAALDIAQKVVVIALVPFQMLYGAVFPHNAKYKDKRFAKRVLYLFVVSGLIGVGVLYSFSSYIVEFMARGDENLVSTSIEVLYYLSPILLFSAITGYLGSSVLVSWGYSDKFNKSVIYSTLIIIFLYLAMWVLNVMTLNLFALCGVFTEMFIVIYRYYYCRKYSIF